jgi:hypothetical protein
MRSTNRKLLKTILVAFFLTTAGLSLSSCSALSGETKIDEGVVIAPKLKIRSSTAMVALDLAEVKRGDRLEILDQAEVKTPTRTEEWYKVRTKDKEAVTGWVESRSVINRAIVGKIDDLYEKSKTTVPQGAGHLKVQTKLRIDPAGEVATLLSRGLPVEVVGKARTTYKPERQQGQDDADEASEEPETRTVLWYQIRLPESEVLRSGWVGAQQVQLDVPDEILHLEGEGRRFTGWIVFDQTKSKKGEIKNNYIGLMKSLSTEGPIDFTRIWFLIYDPAAGRYNGVYIEDGLHGVLPVLMERASGQKGFTINELDESGKTVSIEYEAVRLDSSHVKVKRLSPKITYRRQVRSPKRK